MGFIISDLEDDDKDLMANAWTWGPTVELLKQMNILDAERLEMIRYNCGTTVNQQEACQIGQFLKEKILPKIKPGDRVTLDLEVTDEPDDGTFHRDDLAKNYSTSYEWLLTFSDFCLECRGFQVF